MADSNLSIPMKLDAFVFNQDVCDGGKLDSKIAPITQPNYTFLRIGNEDYLLQNDLLDNVDVSNATPYKRNARLMDLGRGNVRKNRLGVYLHWILPRPYRTGAAATPDAPTTNVNLAESEDTSAPNFRNPPTRWLIIRKLDMNSVKPAGAPIKAIEGWVLESDRLRMLNDLSDAVDLQVDVSPFILSDSKNAENPAELNIGQQAEIFIGYKENAESWKESGNTKTRVNLSLLNSSNQLFPDYQPHNSNIFSAVDTFAYVDTDGSKKALTDANADYYVIGWHESASDDPFTLDGKTRSSRVEELNMTLNDISELNDWLNPSTNTRVVLHGAMYQVQWHDRWVVEEGPSNRPKKVPADAFAKDLIEKMPVAVGTTPMDSLLSYIHAHHEDELENDIYRIAALLRAQSDGLTDQQAGEDEVQNYNFSTLAGGSQFLMPVENDRPAEPPTVPDEQTLKLLNQSQRLLDATSRALEKTQWDLFSLWWKYETDHDNKLPGVMEAYRRQAKKLSTSYATLSKLAALQQTEVNGYIGDLSQAPKQAVFKEFAQGRNPSVFVAGAESGWPLDYLDKLICRLDYQIKTFANPSESDFEDLFIKCLPSELQKTALALAEEFVQNSPSSTTTGEDDIKEVAFKTFPPLYHDQGIPDTKPPPPTDAPWRDRWESTQPWFPLYVEWEVEFFNVEYDKWAVESTTSHLDKQKKFRNGIAPATSPLWEDKNVVADRRTLSGRILILPQPTFDLKAQIDQLFESTPEDILDKYLTKEQREELKRKVAGMAFLSSPLSGFVNQLKTTLEGNHLKPNIRIPGKGLTPMTQAYSGSKNVDIGEEQLRAIGIQSDLTPYGSIVPLAPNGFCAFKPVTHGQFRFKKLNIIDKFGQCAAAIDQRPSKTGPPPLYPCLSDFFAPQTFENRANVAIKPEDPALCEFVQVPPQINQASRLNATFVIPDEDALDERAYWRPTRQWENPILGWVVVNYVNNGIQFFLKDGSFYREARRASSENPFPVAASKRWSPFGKGESTSETDQIDRLISQFTDSDEGQTYLENFIAMITGSVDHTETSPGSYGQFMTALVGKPLALVNAAFTLELATDAAGNESSLKNQDGLHPKYHLLKQTTDQGSQLYQFPLKLGDSSRLYDGLVGYFRAFKEPWTHEAGNELDLTKLYTNFGNVSSQPKFEPIDTSTFPSLEAMYLDPASFVRDDIPDPASAYDTAANIRLNDSVFGCLLDPFVPVHGYTGGGVAPIASLQLPSWTWRGALDRMTAFFHMGPLLVTDDVPAFQQGFALPADYASKLDKLTVPGSAIALPSLRTADWKWLQAYEVQTPLNDGEDSADDDGEDENDDDDEEPEKTYPFMALGLGKLDSIPKFQAGPYTAIEGYLQMSRPIESSIGEVNGL